MWHNAATYCRMSRLVIWWYQKRPEPSPEELGKLRSCEVIRKWEPRRKEKPFKRNSTGGSNGKNAAMHIYIKWTAYAKDVMQKVIWDRRTLYTTRYTSRRRTTETQAYHWTLKIWRRCALNAITGNISRRNHGGAGGMKTAFWFVRRTTPPYETDGNRHS